MSKEIKLDKKTVFVLGAGFTHSFFPGAPLLVDDFNHEELLEKFEKLKYAKDVLEYELSSGPDGKINIENLMTRLNSKMPYDSDIARRELDLLLYDLKKGLINKLDGAKRSGGHKEDLDSLAKICIEKQVSCITFNYDDFFDQSLWEVERVKIEGQCGGRNYWHPDGGYGFFCRPCISIIRDESSNKDSTSMLYLKLHGSVNWFPKTGYEPPYSPDSLVHKQDWFSHLREREQDLLEDIDMHLNDDQFIVPPILSKDHLIHQPLLRIIWLAAREKLKDADNIIFLGYSFPGTDVAAKFLFQESIKKESSILVVTRPKNEDQEIKFVDNYKKIFPRLNEDNFIFQDAREWCNELVSKQPGSPPSSPQEELLQEGGEE